MTTFDWRSIRSVHGSQAGGFEELCAQLVQERVPEGADFVRTGAPDAGVECYWTLPDGTLWGWQAKFFTTSPRSSQWRQIDDSVKTALDKHPRLTRYFVCVPVDLPDGKRAGRTSGREQWNRRVNKWSSWANERGMDVTFEWWGSHELLTMLTAPHHAGRRLFFFGQLALDTEWFRHRLDEAKAAAGPRYTPEVHVNVPISHDLEIFARTEAEFNVLRGSATALRRQLRHLRRTDIQNLETDHGLSISALCVSITDIADAIAALRYQPNGIYPLSDIDTAIDATIESATYAVTETIQNAHQATLEDPEQPANRQGLHDPFNLLFRILNGILRDLLQTHATVRRTERFANAQVAIIEGPAGIGKTHLLCDFATRHVSSAAPVVLLMGQTFTSTDAPTRQVLDILQITDTDNLETFVGAITSAAQAANRRALFIIDAINEGTGSQIWPNHLASLLQVLSRSEWIGTILSVRDGYTDQLIPDKVHQSAVQIRHPGFAGVEFDAVKTFCSYYDMEIPSTPILHPEFSNPLWGKTVCTVLRSRNERRLPRGIHGITSLFNELTSVVNSKLANPERLDYDPVDNLVGQAVAKLAELMVSRRTKWTDRDSAKSAIDSLLPGRRFSESLFQNLVLEGVILVYGSSVHFAYDRMTDHVLAQYYLRSMDVSTLEQSFKNGGPLAFINATEHDFSEEGILATGLTEALSIQVPVLVKKELIEVAPLLGGNAEAISSFCRSIMWRDAMAVTTTTKSIIGELAKQQEYRDEVLEALLTVTVIDNHPLNADFIDQLLKNEPSMASRDAWWTISLYGNLDDEPTSAVKRLLDWALSLSAGAQIDDSTIDLATTTLGWLLTSPNRFLRDQATKAMVSMLDGRLISVQRMLERFKDVNDPSVAERIYAVAYGVTMRSSDATSIGEIACKVYDAVFADGNPPAHILLRDYARNIVERARYLGAATDIAIHLIRPPYRSEFPDIPTSEDIGALDAVFASGDSSDGCWPSGWVAIYSSATEWGDFARYIIGTNSSTESSHWLALSLGEPRWSAPDERYKAFRLSLNATQLVLLNAYEALKPRFVVPQLPSTFFGHDGVSLDLSRDTTASSISHEFRTTEHFFLESLPPEAEVAWQSINSLPPRLDLGIVQRYILRRVIYLGWTAERFDRFDRMLQRNNSWLQNTRQGHKPERIGKKYQWIAYHEILAYIADHYQYESTWGEKAYSGPWQLSTRDIDPSTLPPPRTNGVGTPSESPWWTSFEYNDWAPERPIAEWIGNEADIPPLDRPLIVANPDDPSHQWITAYGFEVRTQPSSFNDDERASPRREVWTKTLSFLVPKDKADDFAAWAKSGELRKRHWHPVIDLNMTGTFWGEHGWAPAANYDPDQLQIEWQYPGHTEPSVAHTLVAVCSTGFGEYDCSVDPNSTPSFHLPSHGIVNGCNLRWTGIGADYTGNDSVLAAFDPSAHEAGPGGLLIRSDVLNNYVVTNNLELCWVVIGEKQTTGTTGQPHGRLEFNGAYIYRDGRPDGSFLCRHHRPSQL